MILQTPENLTAAYLSEALQREVTSWTTSPVGTGQMGDAFRITTDDGTKAILKLAATDDTSRGTGRALRLYEVEVGFYLDLAPSLQVDTPRCFAGDLERDTGWFTLLLEDMAPAVQGDQIDGCDVDQARRALTELAGLHRSGWEDPKIAAIPWLNRTTPESAVFTASMIQGLYPGFLERYGEHLTKSQKNACDALVARLPEYLSRREGPMTVVHGDYRLDNLLFTDDRVTVVDWQTATWGPAMVDTSYFLACALADPAVRAKEERSLLEHYHRELAVDSYSWDQCWADYRRMSFGTLVMAIASSMLVARTERGDRMFLCSVERACAQIDDLDALELLP